MPSSVLIPYPLPPLVYLPTPNQSVRRSKIKGIIIHETEGGYLGAVSWLRNPNVDASAAGVLREDGGQFAQLVPWHQKAWHAEGANDYTLGLELAGFTAGKNREIQLLVAARIVGFWCVTYDILPKTGNRYGENGIQTHRALGSFGGNHSDPGGFDWNWFIKRVNAEVMRGHYRASWGVGAGQGATTNQPTTPHPPTWADQLQLWLTPAGGKRRIFAGWDSAWPAVVWVANNGLKPGTKAAIAWADPTRIERDPAEVVNVCKSLVTRYKQGSLK